MYIITYNDSQYTVHVLNKVLLFVYIKMHVCEGELNRNQQFNMVKKNVKVQRIV